MSAPLDHLYEGEKLTADALVDLFQITLRDRQTIFRFRDGPSTTWQGHVYEGLACLLSGDERTAEGEESRPNLRLLNPVGVFNKPIREGLVERAIVIRRRLLRQHVENDVNIFEQRMWYVGRIRELISGQSLTLELRNMSEGPNYQIPVRMYTPDAGFPFVSL